MITRSPDEFKQAAIKHNIDFWKIHNCSMCDYPCGYIFSDDHERVGYDAGCDCTGRYIIQPRDWGDLSKSYNMQKSEPVIKKMNEFWGFDDRNSKTL